MKNLLLFLFLLSVSVAWGQQRRILHQNFDLKGITAVEFDLRDEYVVELWAGASLLFETTVEMWEETQAGQTDAPEAIFKHFVEKGRYQVAGVLQNGNVLKVHSKDSQRAVIKTGKGVCSEKVQVRIMLPDTFQKTGDHSWLSASGE